MLKSEPTSHPHEINSRLQYANDKAKVQLIIYQPPNKSTFQEHNNNNNNSPIKIYALCIYNNIHTYEEMKPKKYGIASETILPIEFPL